MIPVTLTRPEIVAARECGAERIRLAPGNPRFAYRQGRSGLDTHVIGAMGELAAAKAIGVPWPARINTFRSLPDLDPFWEIRWSSTAARVKIAKDDPPEYLVCLVTGEPPSFQVHGFILAGWAQQHTPLEDPGEKGWAAHFVPSYRLTPINPGFHEHCAWHREADGWRCLYCGIPFDTASPVADDSSTQSPPTEVLSGPSTSAPSAGAS